LVPNNNTNLSQHLCYEKNTLSTNITKNYCNILTIPDFFEKPSLWYL
jgi:hypothetical protein